MSAIDAFPAVEQAIRLSVAPVFLVSGIAGLLGVMATRLARIIDRARDLERRWGELNGPMGHSAALEMVSLERRRRLTSWAINFCTFAALLVCVVIVTLFVAEFVRTNLTLFVGAQFIAAMLCLIGGLMSFLGEVYISTHTLKIQTETFKR